MYLETYTKVYDNYWEAIIDFLNPISNPHFTYGFVFLAVVIFGLYSGKNEKLKNIAKIIYLIFLIYTYFFFKSFTN